MAGCTTGCTSRSCSGWGRGAEVQEAGHSGRFARPACRRVTELLVAVGRDVVVWVGRGLSGCGLRYG